MVAWSRSIAAGRTADEWTDENDEFPLFVFVGESGAAFLKDSPCGCGCGGIPATCRNGCTGEGVEPVGDATADDGAIEVGFVRVTPMHSFSINCGPLSSESPYFGVGGILWLDLLNVVVVSAA